MENKPENKREQDGRGAPFCTQGIRKRSIFLYHAPSKKIVFIYIIIFIINT